MDESQIGIVLLAAGGSTRMGRPKQLLTYRGHSLLRHAAEVAIASPCRPICVVLGAHVERLLPELHRLPVLVAKNTAWETGMGSSIRLGLETVMAAAGPIEAVVLMLCDQPWVSSDTIGRILQAHRASGRPIVASTYGEGEGVPALFGRAFFPELLSLRGPGGAKQIIQRHRHEVASVAVPEGAVDLDTPQEYARLEGGGECDEGGPSSEGGHGIRKGARE